MRKLTSDELERLARELASYAHTGIPMPEGLRQLSRSLTSGALKDAASSAAEAVERGALLSEALRKAPGQIDPQFIALVHCGEISGDMSAILDFAVDHSRRLHNHRSAVLTTVIYPVFVVLALIVALTFFAHYIMPKVVDIFHQLGAELPALTMLVVNLAYAMRGPAGSLLTVALVSLIVFLIFYKPFHAALYRGLGYLPGFDSLVALSDTALVMKFLDRMLSRGVPLPAALAASSLAVSRWQARMALLNMSRAAEQGHAVGGLLADNTPATAAWLFRQAESRGTLASACAGIADYCEDRFERLSKRSVAILEPALLLIMSLVIGTVLMAMYLPLFNIPKVIGVE